jgi:mono/diheme cytochrome c family protein
MVVFAGFGWATAALAAAEVKGAALEGVQTFAQMPADPATLATMGKRIYTGMCTRCHGINMASNGIGFDLRKFPADGRERFERSVSEGLRAMPAWKTILKPGDTDALWAYIGSVNNWQQVPPPQ